MRRNNNQDVEDRLNVDEAPECVQLDSPEKDIDRGSSASEDGDAEVVVDTNVSHEEWENVSFFLERTIGCKSFTVTFKFCMCTVLCILRKCFIFRDQTFSWINFSLLYIFNCSTMIIYQIFYVSDFGKTSVKQAEWFGFNLLYVHV